MKKLFTLLLSLTMVIAVNAADKFAQGPISWSTGPWYDAATAGNPVSAPVAGDNVFPQNFKITVDVDATCDNYTLTTGVASNLVINAGITLTVRGTISAPALVDVDLTSGSDATSKLKLTGESLATTGTFSAPIFLITDFMVKSIRPRGMFEIATGPSTGVYAMGVTQGNTFTLSNCKTVVKSGSNVVIGSRANIGKIDGTNEFTIESNATVYSKIFEGAFDGRKTTAAKLVIDGTLIATDATTVRNIVLGTNGVFKTQRGNTETNVLAYPWVGWWHSATPSSYSPMEPGAFATPGSLVFGSNSTVEFNKTAEQYIPGTIPENKLYFLGTGTTSYIKKKIAITEDSIFASYKVPYANIVFSAASVKKVQSNLTATGNVTIASGSVIVPDGVTMEVQGTLSISAGALMVVHGTVTGTPTLAGALINAKSSNSTMGTVSSTISAANLVTLVAAPKAGYVFVNWTEASTEISTSATYPAFTPANLDNRTLIANFVVDPLSGLSVTKTNAFVTVVGNTLNLNGNVTAVEVFDAQGRRIVSQANVTSVNVKGNGIYIVRMHTAQGVNTQKINVK